ncbi:MAG: VWA domain-containing protein [Acidobacteria bacterium]|nr:VWA domain-containing protein [Acidobacteriota bacterium]MCL5286712.1 VWA domain-containing protein [Acidobacteriota bacterium]
MRKPTPKLPLLCMLLLLALLAPMLPWPARAQQSAQQQERPQETIRVGVNLVNLYVTVRDKNKRILPDLTEEDFQIFEDGQPQKIDSFAREVNLPLTFGMLIDTSISQERVLPMEQDAADRFLERVLRAKDLAFVLSFDVNVDLLGDYTGERRELMRAIQRARINSPMPDGPVARSGPVGTKLYDAIYAACKDRLAGEAGRKALIILTDAVDAGSQVPLEEALEVAQRNDTVIHIIGVADYGFYGWGGYSGEGYAKKLAEQTGGRSIFVNNEKKLEEAFTQISEELRTQYVLGYYPTNRSKDGKFRKIEIKVKRNDAKVLARKGYYAPKQ